MRWPRPGSENRLLDKKTLNKIYAVYQLEADFGYERFQGAGFAYYNDPALEKLYSDPAECEGTHQRATRVLQHPPTCVTLITRYRLRQMRSDSQGEGSTASHHAVKVP